MKKFFFTFFLLFAVNLTLLAEKYNVLFLGNSYTSVNNLPEMVKTVAASCGDTIIYQSNTPGGCTFQQHLTNNSATLIQQGGWDYVVLQEQSQLPSFPMGQFMEESYPYAEELCDLIKEYNPNAEIVFYMTWGRKNGDQANAQFFEPLGTYEGMDALLRERYIMMAEDNDANVAPVGPVWHYIRDHHSEIELYSSDGSHPSLVGTYAAACTFYTILFQKSPLLISTDCNVEAQMADIVRQCTKKVAFDSIGNWLFSMSVDTTSTNEGSRISNYFEENISVYPNPTSDEIHVQFHVEDPADCKIMLYNSQGRIIDEWTNIEPDEMQLNVSKYNSGIYFLKISADNQILETKKIVIKH